ncbi:MAG TPA: ATP-dependent protease LonB [Candidatus Norongarragalinales archaeon]|jgi:Lon-like ATP-dependent protease|nr:ATP-dependent protease LonB [Candidatus Norongarragalinales archaeon]
MTKNANTKTGAVHAIANALKRKQQKTTTQHAATHAHFNTTSDLPVSNTLIEQVIGQDRAVDAIRKAAAQKRNVLLIGEPGTGKSMLAQAMAELLPTEELQDILIIQNKDDENKPKVRAVKVGTGKRILEAERMKNKMSGGNVNIAFLLITLLASAALLFYGRTQFGDVITAALLIILGLTMAATVFGAAMMRARPTEQDTLKLLIDNAGKTIAPFVDGTGSRAGALLGDVRHDPFQSGGLGTPAHLRIEAGFIHRANKGVLFVDEVSSLRPKSQQELLTAMQEKKYSITGQSEMSSGAMVHTEPVPCDFVLVAAGNYSDVKRMHPALRSRIRGYGYEVYMQDVMPDTPENRQKVFQFIAQEVRKDAKIPHFDKSACEEIIKESRKRAGRKNKLTLKWRDLGGLVRAAGDLARTENATTVTADYIHRGKTIARTLEQQMAQQIIDVKREYAMLQNKGTAVGKINGLAVMGDSGIVTPIEAEVAPAASKTEGKIIATGKLGEIASEAVQNVSAIIKRHTGKDVSSYDIHIQFIQTYEGVEGDSASVSVAAAVLSALESLELRQDTAMTGSLSVRGEVLPVGGVNQKIEAAAEAGIKRVIIPASNKDDVIKDNGYKIDIIPAATIYDVLKAALADSSKTKEFLKRFKTETE